MDIVGKLEPERASTDERLKKRSKSCEKQATQHNDSQTINSILILQLHQLPVRQEQNGAYCSEQHILVARSTTCSVVVI